MALALPLADLPYKNPVPSARKAVDPKSPCSIMKACGGCTALNRPYKKQLATKQAAMEELFAALCEHEGISVDPIRGMGVTLGDPGKYPAPYKLKAESIVPCQASGRYTSAYFMSVISPTMFWYPPLMAL